LHKEQLKKMTLGHVGSLTGDSVTEITGDFTRAWRRATCQRKVSLKSIGSPFWKTPGREVCILLEVI